MLVISAQDVGRASNEKMGVAPHKINDDIESMKGRIHRQY